MSARDRLKAELRAGDRAWIEYGGMSAAIGIVPIEVWRERDGRRAAILELSVDVHQSDDSPEAIARDLARDLESVARECGAQMIEAP